MKGVANVMNGKKHARLALFWSVIGAVGVALALPYTLELQPKILEQSPLGLPALVVAQMVQIGLTLFLGGWAALKLGAAIGLDSPIARSWVYKTDQSSFDRSRVLRAAGLGVGLGLVAMILDRFVFLPLLPEAKVVEALSVPRWKALLASIYGGVTEELLLRLILMTVVAWLLARVVARDRRRPPAKVFHAAVIASALLFALGHLPAAAGIWELTPWVVTRVLVLNAYGAVPFGYLYWRWGLEYAMVAHFFADIALHVVGGA